MEKQYKAQSNGITATCRSTSILTYSCTIENVEDVVPFSADNNKLIVETLRANLEFFINETKPKDLPSYDAQVTDVELSKRVFSNISQETIIIDQESFKRVEGNITQKSRCNG